MKLPKTRNENMVVQDLDDEVLTYDLITDKACRLNKTSAIIYRHCDGQTSLDELKLRHRLTDDIIYLALDELEQQDLLENYVSPLAGFSRREIIRRAALTSLVALPVISSLIAPTAAMAQSVVVCSNPTGQPTGSTVTANGPTTFTCQLALINQCCIPGIKSYKETPGPAGSVNCAAVCDSTPSTF